VLAAKMVSVPVKTARVLLVDDHPAVLRQVEQLLAGEFEVVGALADGIRLPQEIMSRQPDVLVLDVMLPWKSGLDLARGFGVEPSAPRIVFLTVHTDPDYAREAMAAGGLGYVVKARLASDLLPALHAALDGRQFISPGVVIDESTANHL
jgi:DNA-binding NarL/FixJ family response regulator